MSRYVDADIASIYLNSVACEQIKQMPTADVQEIRRGKWLTPKTKYPYYNWRCSICDCEEYRQTDQNGRYRQMKYCPNCGAKMEENENE